MLKNLIPARRWLTAIFGTFGFVVVYGLKVNLSVGIVAMVNHTAINVAQTDSFNNTTDSNNTQDGPFVWDEMIQGYMLAAYFYGYILTEIPGAWIAEKYSAKHVFGAGVIINIIGTLFFPLASQQSWICALVIRIIMGAAAGVTLPAMHVLISKWAPPLERSTMSSTVYAGMPIGVMLSMPFSGLLADSIGWKGIFYVQAGLSMIWCILWIMFVYDSPSVDPNINDEERDFIVSAIGTPENVGQITEKQAVPIKAIMTSSAFWAIIVAHTCCNWGWYMLLLKLPTYMKYILKFDMSSNATLSAIPYLCNNILNISLARTMDYLLSKKKLTTTVARKISTFIAMIPSAVFLILVPYVNVDWAVAFIIMGTMFMGAMYSGFLANHIDIAPQYAGTLMGITNTFATIPGIVMPSVIGIITYGNQTVQAWSEIFYISFGISLFGAIFYLIFGSGEKQEWAAYKEEIQQDENKEFNIDKKSAEVKENLNSIENISTKEPVQV